ncbi:DNA-binding MarR family transcriptional regulator [Prauserella shujinwangii]|uniref:DNA-binding MarR family transcriptional regulator n=1 Tax=Prauserella shujinwangii TaxID=1453103 RepID=A0A2T0LSJ6_9PSEU|nr:MarR family transcriptional regulator [Prauserella shujinwangii]PRX46593.1 DNA-binding MarR family transcriptional regulator [Prauserella shujinwangii]
MDVRDARDTGDATAGPRLSSSLARAARAVTARVEQVLRSENVTFDQWLVLDALAAEGGLTMSELTARTLATGPTLTRVVDRLVTVAAAYREVDLDDRRRVRVHLSTRGRAQHARLAGRVAEVEEEMLGSLSRTGPLFTALDRLGDG